MRKTLTLTLLAAALGAGAAVALPARAGSGESCGDAGMPGFECDHVCPLAREANGHRSAGAEATAMDATVRAALAAAVEKNLRRM